MRILRICLFRRTPHEGEHKENQARCFCCTTNLPEQKHSLHGPSFHCSIGDFNVVVYSAATDANSANHPSIRIFDGYSAAKSDQTAIAVFDPVKRLARLRHLPDFGCVHIKITGRSSFSDGDVNTAKPGAIHTNERLEISACVYNRDIFQYF